MNIRSILKTVLPLCTGIISLVQLHCSSLSPNETSSTGGTGSEVVGVVEYPDTEGAPKVRGAYAVSPLPVIDGSVFINPRSYLAKPDNGGEAPKAITRADGFFRISNVLPGEHLVYIRDSRGNAVATTITVPEDSTTVDCGTLVARKTATVSIDYTGTTPGEVLFYIDVRGTGIQLKCTGRNVGFKIDKIPTGVDHIISIRMYKPIHREFDVLPVTLVPDMVKQLESFTGD